MNDERANHLTLHPELRLQLSQFAMDNVSIEIYWLDSDARICYANNQACKTLGYTREELLKLTLADLDPNYPMSLWNEHWKGLVKDKTQSFETLHKRKNGEVFPVEVVANYVSFGGHEYNVGFAKDISERKRAQDALHAVSERLNLATRAAGVGIWDFDVVQNILTWDDQMFALYGISRDQFSGAYAAWREGLHPDDMHRGDLEIQSALRGEKDFDTEFRVCWPDGSIRSIRAVATVQHDSSGQPIRMVGTNWDITVHKQAEQEIHELAFFDTLTGLPNRRLLMDRIRQALPLSARSNQFGALLFLDLDRFKTINDTLGHDHGDLLLVEVSKRLLLCVRKVDTVARLGGDEFVILIEEICTHATEASQKVAVIAEKIRLALAAPYQFNDYTYHSSPSIGVCLYHGDDESAESLLKHADMAMYQAKDAGRNAVRFFDTSMQLAVESHAAIEADFRHAVPDNQLRLFYQIQMDNDNRPLGAEALVRWVHPSKGMISPAQFIPIAEESSLILDAGRWVLQSACRQLALWSTRVQTCQLELAINVSAQQFRSREFVEEVASAVNLYQINPSRLKLELTEGVVLADVSDVVAKMYSLKALGIKLSLDDFGTGYSSLSYLKQLPLDQLKIDQSFVRDITTDINDAVNRIAVRFAYEWRDVSGLWFRSYGNENWEFNAQGFMMRRFASINDLPIPESERKFFWPLGRRPDDHPELGELGL